MMETHCDNRQRLVLEENGIYTFRKREGRWFIHLTDYLQGEKHIPDYCLMEDVHRFLNMLSNGGSRLRLRVSTHPFEEADKLELIEHCTAPKGGAIYLFVPANGKGSHSSFWICDLALFVFGDMPECIYIKR